MFTYNISNIDNINIEEIKQLIEANDFDRLVSFLLRSYESLGPIPAFYFHFWSIFAIFTFSCFCHDECCSVRTVRGISPFMEWGKYGGYRSFYDRPKI